MGVAHSSAAAAADLQMTRSSSGHPRWRPDSSSSACDLCAASFTFVRRRHHCRACGALVCGACSAYRGPLPSQQRQKEGGFLRDFVGPSAVRLCRSCFVHGERAADNERRGRGGGNSDGGSPHRATAAAAAAPIGQMALLRGLGEAILEPGGLLADALGAGDAAELRRFSPEERGAIVVAMFLGFREGRGGRGGDDENQALLGLLTQGRAARGASDALVAHCVHLIADEDVANLTDHDCAVCQDALLAAHNARDPGAADDDDAGLPVQLPCRHVFHHRCVRTWLQQQNECPLCRAPLRMDLPDE